jgi:A118 family predicted phage portal protein
MTNYENFKLADLPGYRYRTKVSEWLAWYSGDPEILANYYAYYAYNTNYNGRFYANLSLEERANIVHLPLAGDICAMSSNLLFSEPPEFQYDEGQRATERITSFLLENDMTSKLPEAAEVCAAVGGVYLKLDVDPEISGVPLMTVRMPQHVIPTFRSDKMTGVKMWRDVRTEKNTVWRLMEHRYNERGDLFIEYDLYKGNTTDMGSKVDMNSIEETAGLEPIAYRNFDGLGVVYVPNYLPNRMFPGSNEGMSDFAGTISLLDSLDEAYTSWMRDLELGMARLMIDETTLDVKGTIPTSAGLTVTDRNPRFDPHQRAYLKLALDDWKHDGSKPIEMIQFAIRVDEHLKTCQNFTEQIISLCGYSPQSFGMDVNGQAQSGSALRIRERKSMLTRQKKARYWQNALQTLVYQMQQMDGKSGLATPYEPLPFNAILQDSIVRDEKEISETVRALKQADAISTEQAIKMIHPDWDKDAVQEELDRINAERGASIPDSEFRF